MKILHLQTALQFINNSGIVTRPNVGPGLWLMFLLPLALIISTSMHPVISTSTYKLSSLFSVGLICSSVIFLYQSSKAKKLRTFNVHILTAGFITGVLFRICLHRGILFSIWSGGISTMLYHQVYLLILQSMPSCFTLGEAAISAQSLILLLYFTSVNIFENLMKTATNSMQISTLIIQVGLTGVALIALTVYYFKVKDPLKFYTLSFLVLICLVILPLQFLLKKNPLLWIIDLLLDDIQSSKVALYWGICTAVTVLFVIRRVNEAKKASTIVRKVFHILTVVVFIPGLLYNCALLYLASGIIFGSFFVFEMMRVLNIPPLGVHLQNVIVVFGDAKDVGIIAFTPIYLLAGCSLPLWIHPAPCDVTNSAVFNLLPLLSGLLATGLGDTGASVIGSKFGRHQWHGSKKTIEGTIACVVSQLLFIFILVYLDILKLLNVVQFVKVVVAVIITSLVEAKTDQVDNLIMPFIMYIILIV